MSSKTKFLPVMALALAVAGPAFAAEPYTRIRPSASAAPITSSDQPVAFVAGDRSLDLARGTWGSQPLNPPSGLLSTRIGDMVGMTVYDALGVPAFTISGALIEPATYEAYYVVATPSAGGGGVLIPATAMLITPESASVATTTQEMAGLRRYSTGEITRRYPNRPVAAVPMMSPVAGGGPITVSTRPTPDPAPPPRMSNWRNIEPLILIHQGNGIGAPVVDSAGQSVGTVSGIAIGPANREARYYVISGPEIGQGMFIAVPVAYTQSAGGRVAFGTRVPDWRKSQRYDNDQVLRQYATFGVE